MAAQLQSRLAEARQTRGLTQAELAERVGISRQSLGSVEGGRSVPSTAIALRLAAALGARVEELFWFEEAPGTLEAELAGDGEGERVALVRVGERWVAHRLSAADPIASTRPADGIVAPRAGRLRGERVAVELLASREALADNLLCVGCAPALGVLAARASEGPAPMRVTWLGRSSADALSLLARGHAHVAGVHLFDEATGEFNVPFARRALAERAAVLVTLARWEAGLLVAPGNPLGLRGVGDLARPGVVVGARETGSGAQQLLLRLAQGAGLALSDLTFGGLEATSHLDAARSVALGVVDAVVAIRGAAMAFGLGFLPLAEERFDLVIPKELVADRRVARLLETLSGGTFRRELAGLGGYEARDAGAVVAELGP